MKRQLSLVLALVMILGSFSTVFAAMPETANEKATFLAEKGILKGNLEGDLNLTQDLKRRDALVVLSRLFDVEEEAKAYPAEDLAFVDITDAYYAGFIAWAVEEGYTDGKTETIYDPNGPLTAQQFATFLLRALQYQENGENIFDKAFEEATKLGILEGAEVEKKDTVKRSDMAAMTFNALGVKVKGTDKTLAETLGIEMPAPPKATELKVEKVYTENLAEIRVKLSNTELVKTRDALYNPANYRLTNTNAKVRHVHLEEDELVLTLVPYGKVLDQPKFEVLEKGKAFKLTIRNVDPKINETSGWITPVDNTIPVVENVEFMGTYGIKVTTSEPIENPEERNFRIDSRTSMLVEQYGRDIILTPYHGKSFDKDAVTLTTDILEDFAGYKTVKEDHAMKLSDDEGLPVVKKAYRSGSKVVVEFDRDVYEKSVGAYENRKDFGNISFVERRAPFYAKDAVKVDINVVEYTFEREVPKGIVVEIEGVANHFNKAMERAEVEVEEFKDEFAPAIIDYTENVAITKAEQTTIDGLTTAQKDQLWLDGKVVATDVMELEFDKDMAELKDLTVTQLNARLGEYFTLYERDITTTGMKAASGVTFQVVKKDSDWLQLEFNNIMLNNKNKDFDYVLEVRNFSDSNRIRMDIEYLDFQVVQRKATFRVIPKIEINSNSYFNRKGSEIILKFNRPVNKEEAANAKNYYLDSKLHVAEAIVERDGKTVALIVYDKTPAQLKAGYSVLEISPRVVDLSVPAQSVAERFWDLKTGEFIPGVEGSKSKVTAISTTSITVDGKAVDIAGGSDLAAALAAMTDVTELLDAKVELVLNAAGKATSIEKIELAEKNYSNNTINALVQYLNDFTIEGQGITKTQVLNNVMVTKPGVTITKVKVTGDLIISLGDSSDVFTSKDNWITGNTNIVKGIANFNTRIDGNVTVAAGAKATFTNVEFASTTVLTATGTAKVTLVGKTGDLKADNIVGTVDAEESDLKAGVEAANELAEALAVVVAKEYAKADTVKKLNELKTAAIAAGEDFDAVIKAELNNKYFDAITSAMTLEEVVVMINTKNGESVVTLESAVLTASVEGKGAVTEVLGEYTIAITGTLAKDNKITIDGKTVTIGDTATATVAGLVELVNAETTLKEKYTASAVDEGKLKLVQKIYSADAPTATTEVAELNLAVAVVKAPVKSEDAIEAKDATLVLTFDKNVKKATEVTVNTAKGSAVVNEKVVTITLDAANEAKIKVNDNVVTVSGVELEAAQTLNLGTVKVVKAD